MSTTSAALDWLLSLSATFTSSPLPNSDPPDFTDWLQGSPTTSSPSAPLSSSPPLQDIARSFRVNLAHEQDLGLNYLYDLSGYFGSDISTTSGSQSDQGTRGLAYDDLLPRSVQPVLFNEHHRMTSLESTSATLVNTPSPKTHLFAPALTDIYRNDNAGSPFGSSSLRSPATKFVEDLQHASYGSYYAGIFVPPLQAQATTDISPVVRSADVNEPLPPFDVTQAGSKRKLKGKKHRNKQKENKLSFVQQLQAVEPSLQQLVCEDTPRESLEPGRAITSSMVSCPSESYLPEATLLSPCRINVTQPPVKAEAISQISTLPLPMPKILDNFQNMPSTPPQDPMPMDALSPLTPLPSQSSSPEPLPRLKIVLNLKRARPNENAAPPVRRSKRPRKAVVIIDSPSPSPTLQSSQSDPPSTRELSVGDEKPIYTNRTLPPTIEISDKYPLFYRRYPASSYYQNGSEASPCTLFGLPHPGGVYNVPRGVLDLYTPRFVKGKGVDKVGLCPICIEPHERGGEKKKLWLAMKFSAFKCYHMQYAHGISAASGRPFSPPVSFRIVPRINPGKKEKLQIQQGKCHKCRKWVPVEGIKDMESKVKELYWWKHAASCHQESTLDGECDYYEDDHVLATLLSSIPASGSGAQEPVA